MTLPVATFLLVGLSLYSYLLIRRAGYLQRYELLPFLYQLHSPKVLDVITDEEHESIHQQIDMFNLRILVCFICAIVGTGAAALFIMLVANGGDGKIAGYIMAVAFAILVSNWSLNSTLRSWVRSSESTILARVLEANADAKGYDSVYAYLDAENQKMIDEAREEIKRVADEFEQVCLDLGWDPDKTYETEEEVEELFRIQEKAVEELKNRETSEK